MKAIARQSLADTAADQIRQAILSGELPVGTPLRQVDLANRMGVSRTPLRDAMVALTAEGLIEDTTRGYVVARVSEQDVVEFYEIREELEALAGRLAASKRTDEDIDRLREIHDQLAQTRAVADWQRLNDEFHNAMYRVSGRGHLCELIGALRNRTGLYIRIRMGTDDDRTIAQQEHEEILKAFERGDAVTTENAIRHHMRTTVTTVLQASPETVRRA